MLALELRNSSNQLIDRSSNQISYIVSDSTRATIQTINNIDYLVANNTGSTGPVLVQAIVTSGGNTLKSKALHFEITPVPVPFTTSEIVFTDTLSNAVKEPFSGSPIRVNVNVTKNDIPTSEGKLVIAVFSSSNKLLQLSHMQIQPTNGQKIPFSTIVNIPQTGGYTIKAFVIDSFGAMRTLSDYTFYKKNL